MKQPIGVVFALLNKPILEETLKSAESNCSRIATLIKNDATKLIEAHLAEVEDITIPDDHKTPVVVSCGIELMVDNSGWSETYKIHPQISEEEIIRELSETYGEGRFTYATTYIGGTE